MSTDTTMADAITALVEQKRAVGYKYAAEARVLARFAAFCHSEFPALAVPDQASVEAWLSAARRRAVTPATLQGLAAPVRELARWLGRRGVPAYVLPKGTLPRPARYVPHVHTCCRSATRRAARTGSCPSARRCTPGWLATTHRSSGVRAATGSSLAGPGSR